MGFCSGLRHPNVVLFMGAAVDNNIPVIVTEFMPRGSLYDVLQGFPGNMPYDLQIHIAYAAASGMVCVLAPLSCVLHGHLIFYKRIFCITSNLQSFTEISRVTTSW